MGRAIGLTVLGQQRQRVTELTQDGDIVPIASAEERQAQSSVSVPTAAAVATAPPQLEMLERIEVSREVFMRKAKALGLKGSVLAKAWEKELARMIDNE
jgi:hypothetical protein